MASEARLTLLIPNSQDGIQGVAGDFEKFCAANRLLPSATWPFQVALDEVLSNTVRCGYGSGAGDRRIEIRIQLKDRVLELAIVDDGAPFNPLEAKEPDTTRPLADRPIGGLGIHVVRTLMDEVEYERKQDRNCLTLRKKIEA